MIRSYSRTTYSKRIITAIAWIIAFCLILAVLVVIEGAMSSRNIEIIFRPFGLPAELYEGIFMNLHNGIIPDFRDEEFNRLSSSSVGPVILSLFLWFLGVALTISATLVFILATISWAPTYLVGLFRLRTERDLYGFEFEEPSMIENIQSQIHELRYELGKTSVDLVLSEEEKQSLLEAAKQSTLTSLTDETREVLRLEALDKEYRKTRAASLSRLGEQGKVYGSRANLNLVAGLMFCSIGLLLLWTTLFDLPTFGTTRQLVPRPNPPEAAIVLSQPPLRYYDWFNFLENYLPRISLILIVELIGFFFLRLYLRTLGDIRYVQNELTNVEMKLIAMDMAIIQGHTKGLTTVLESLSATERNSVIGKDQTSIEIEKFRAETEASDRVISMLPQLFHGTEHRSFWKRS